MDLGKWWELLYPIKGALITLTLMLVFKDYILSLSPDISLFTIMALCWFIGNVLIYLSVLKIITNGQNDFIVKITNTSPFKRFKGIVRYDMLNNAFFAGCVLMAPLFEGNYFVFALISAVQVRSVLALLRTIRIYNILVRPNYNIKD